MTEAVAVLVCTRGRPDLLEDCLSSILASEPASSSVVLVESGPARSGLGSLDGDARVLHLLVDRPGKSRQLNEGLRAITEDVVVLTDDDCRVEPGWVAAMTAPFEDAAVGAVFGPVGGLSGVRGVRAEQPRPGLAPEITWAYANGAAMAVRRSAVVAIGGFDERLGPGAAMHGEEHDLVLRLQEAGWTVHVADAPPVRHLEWRDDAETRRNLLVYSRGAGAFLGAALRRAPGRWARTVLRRVRYQGSLWRHRSTEGAWFGPATTLAFARGLVRGFLLPPRRYL